MYLGGGNMDLRWYGATRHTPHRSGRVGRGGGVWTGLHGIFSPVVWIRGAGNSRPLRGGNLWPELP